MEDRKLIKVCAGLYRDTNGGLRVSFEPWGDKKRPWVARWQALIGGKIVKRFGTLSEVQQRFTADTLHEV